MTRYGGPSGPAYFRRQAHQNGFNIPAGLETKQRAPIIEQIKFDISTTPDKLVVALFLSPVLVHAIADNG